MKIINVEANDKPLSLEILGNKKLSNFNIQKIQKVNMDNEPYEMYSYQQIKFDISYDDAYITKVTKEEVIKQKISEAKQYLADTDFYMVVDKYATLSSR